MDTKKMLLIGAVLAAAAVAAYVIYTKFIAKKPVGTPSAGTGTGIGVIVPTPIISTSSTVIVQINAIDYSDAYPRDWNIFTVDPSGTARGGGTWSAGQPIQTTDQDSGATWTIELAKGTYYFLVGQSGGQAYGTYSGTINAGGNSTPFQGVDVNHAVQFTV